RATDTRAAAIVDRCDDMPPEVWTRLHGAVRALGTPSTTGQDPPAATGPGSTLPGTEEPSAGDPTSGQQVPWWDPAADTSVDPGTDSVLIAGVEVKRGTPVRLQPSRRADAHDLFLRDKAATVAGVFQDVDGSRHIAVTLDDDPARDELLWQGRYLYFYPDEIVPLADRR